MKKSFFLLPLVAILSYVALTGYSSGAGASGAGERTGATGSTSGCGGCHGSSATSSLRVTLMLDSAGTSVTRYVAGRTYKVVISGSNGTGSTLPRYGFQLAVVQSSGAGSSSATDGGTLASSGLRSGTRITSTGGITVYEHSTRLSPVSGSGSSGSTVYADTILWTAPSAGTGSVVIYGIMNAVNNASGADGGDKWNLASPITITELTTSSSSTIGPITGSSLVCVGDTTRLSDTTAGGTWSSSNPSVATISTTGLVTGVSSGTVTISYYTRTDTATFSMTVNPAVSAGIVSGPPSLCVGSSGRYRSTVAGGSWISGNPSVATISSSTGDISPLTAGTTVISYMVTSSTCPPAFATRTLTVLGPPALSPISGRSTICVGDTATYTDTARGGVWSIVGTSVATINPTTGLVRALTTGVDTIKYTATNSCGTSVQPFVLTVNPAADAGVISGTSVICSGTRDTFTTTGSSGGTWSSDSTTIISIASGTGILTALSAGTTTIRYRVFATGCGAATATFPVTVVSSPSAGGILGPSSVCTGVPTSYGASVGGGTWSMSPTSVATFDASSGILTGRTAGTVNLTYTVVSSCGRDSAISSITVNSSPEAGTAVGPTSLCVGAAISVSSAGSSGSGLWISSNTSVATVNAVSGSGRAVGGGTATLAYIVSSASCGNDTAFLNLTVDVTPTLPSISGPSTACVGTSDTFRIAATGGIWTSSNPAAARIDSVTGIVSTVSSGSSTISYVVTNACGSTSASATFVVSAAPVAGSIVGTDTICVGRTDTFTLSSGATAGGNWSSSNSSIASVLSASGGVFQGVAAGNATISYTVSTTGCAAVTATKSIIVSPPANAGTISGTSTVCVGSTTSLSSTVSGGTWTTSDVSLATVSSAGLVLARGAGSVNISYSVTTRCGSATAVYPVTIITTPSTPTISGADSVCESGGTIAMTPSVGGGTWSVSSTSIASVNTSGTVVGLAAGVDTVFYTVSNVCGASIGRKNIVVKGFPNPGSFTDSVTVCVGSTVSLSPTVAGGTWTTSSSSIATVDASGTITGLGAGVVTITHSFTNSCGTRSAVRTAFIITAPVTGTVSGSTATCVGTPVTYSFTGTGGGTWSSSDVSVATVTSGGLVTPVGAGTVTISYELRTTCDTISGSRTLTVAPAPDAGTISGISGYCPGGIATLTTTGTGGTWSSSNTTVASISSTTGDVTALAPGTSNIVYTVSAGSCGTVTSSYTVTVATPPSAGVISGSATVCEGASTALSTTGSGGSWSSSAPTVATVNSAGTVSGLAGGTATISYIATNACSADTAYASITVDPLPVLPTVSGPSSLCPAATVSLTGTPSGGTWTSSNTAVASVSSTGAVYGVASGTATISYALTNACGTRFTTYVEVVNPVPVAGIISGPSTLCTSTSGSLTTTGSGGVWSTASASIASVNTSGTVFAVSAGTTTISYIASNSCGRDTATYSFTSSLTPTVGSISGAITVCQASSVVYTNTTSGGVWSSSNTSVATVSTGGTVFGVAGGTATITYTLTTSCGTATATRGITVNPLPNAGSITGADSVCLGTSISISSTGSAGGTWSSSAPSVATVSTTGSVFGTSVGTATISYVVTNTCGTATATRAFRVLALPSAGTLSGAATVCTGASTIYSSTVAGGSWTSSDPSIATVFGTGSVSGVAVGTATITYTFTNSCGSATATQAITVNTVPTVAAITGASSLCAGSAITLSSSTTGGTWSSSATSVASVDAASGTVLGIGGGTATISYTVSNICGSTSATQAITVNTAPSVGALTGTFNTCPGTSSTLASSTSGGTWTSSSATVATVDASGNVFGVSAGSATISYTVTNSCGTTTRTAAFTVNPLPFAGTLSGTTTLCVGTSATLTSTVSGGSWSTTSGTVASVSSVGLVQALTTGTANVVYSVTNVCGSATSTALITVLSTPVTGTITGPTVLCAGSTATLSASVSGGTWSASNSNAVVSSAGVVTGVRVGTVIISYSLTNICGTGSSTTTILIDTPLAVSATIAGPVNLCEGDTALYVASVTGGTWASRTGRVFITAAGRAAALVPGNDTISYSISNGCGTYTARLFVTVTATALCGLSVQDTRDNGIGISIYPNPSEGVFAISIPSQTTYCQVVVTDVTGAIVFKKVVTDASAAIPVNLEAVARGNYIVRVIADGKTYQQKISIVR